MSNDISVNLEEVMKRLPEEKDAKKAMYRAFSRAVGPAKTLAAKETANKYMVSKKQVQSIADVKRSPSNASINIVWKDGMIPLDQWEETQPKSNYRTGFAGRASSPLVTSKHKKAGGSIRYTSSFVANMGGGNRVYRRTSQARFPIKRVWGPAIPQLMNSLSLQVKIMDRVKPIIDKRIEHEINYMLSKKP